MVYICLLVCFKDTDKKKCKKRANFVFFKIQLKKIKGNVCILLEKTKANTKVKV